MLRFKGTFLVLLVGSVFSMPATYAQGKKRSSPKNIIMMIGDGVGYNHILAANYYLGMASQVQERFPVRLAMAHFPALVEANEAGNPAVNHPPTGYNPALAWRDTAYLKRDYTESAAAATALATGFKTYNGAIGMSVDNDTLENLVEWAKSLDKSAGVVTTVEFCHATPAGFAAHNIKRSNYAEIAAEMLLDSRCDVIMGCGNPMFDNDGGAVNTRWQNPKYVVDSVFWTEFLTGSGKQVKFTANGKARIVKDVDGDKSPDPWTVIRDLRDFQALQKGKTPIRILGCPKVYETLQQGRIARDGEMKNSEPYTTPFVKAVPTLSEMVGGALNVLDNNPKGFFVMIEGGATDWASHSNQKGRLIEEMCGFFDAINTVVGWIEKNSSWDETMLIVTGDHETGLLWGERPFVPLADNGKGKLPEMTFFSKDHSNSLIPFYAKGPGSELFQNFADESDTVRGSYIQNSEVAKVVHLLWPK